MNSYWWKPAARGKDVSVSMKRGAEKASSLGDDRSREVVTILLSLDWVLMNFRVAEMFCEDRFSDAVIVRGLESGLCVCVRWPLQKKFQETTTLLQVELVMLVKKAEFQACECCTHQEWQSFFASMQLIQLSRSLLRQFSCRSWRGHVGRFNVALGKNNIVASWKCGCVEKCLVPSMRASHP